MFNVHTQVILLKHEIKVIFQYCFTHPYCTWILHCYHAHMSIYLRTFALIVSAHPYCERNSHATSCIERALKWTILGQMAIATTLRGFSDLERSVTPIFISMGHFLYRFSTFWEKMKKNLSSRSLNILQNAPSNSVHLTSSSSCASVSNASLRIKVSENDGNIWNY